MAKLQLTKFSKILIGIIFILLIITIIYLICSTYIVTESHKIIKNNNELILKPGMYISNPFKTIGISDFPVAYPKPELPDELNLAEEMYISKDIPLILQLSNGKIYKCYYYIASTYDKDWVIQNKISPTITIPQYSLNSHMLDYIGAYSEEYLFKAETKHELEEIIKDWLIKNTKNHGIIIKAVKIHSEFKPVQQ